MKYAWIKRLFGSKLHDNAISSDAFFCCPDFRRVKEASKVLANIRASNKKNRNRILLRLHVLYPGINIHVARKLLYPEFLLEKPGKPGSNNRHSPV